MGQDTVAKHLDASKNTFQDTDAKGRIIVLRKPTCLQKFELTKILGEDSMNQLWHLQCMMLLHVVSIDGDPAFFGKESELKALVNTLDDDGMATVEKLFQEHFMPKSLLEAKDEVKK